MATDAPSSLPALQAHLTAIISSDPPPELDVRLVETFTAQLTYTNSSPLIPLLIPTLTSALQSLQSDPTPITTLIIRLLSSVPFHSILQLTSDKEILSTLVSPSPAVQLLGLNILSKARGAPNEAGILASWPEVVKALITLVLSARDTEVAGKAAEVLVGLLTVDVGVLERRVLGDEAVFRIFFELAAWDGQDLGGAREKTEAQSRLLGLLPGVVGAVGWDAVVGRCKVGGKELVVWAATEMVRVREDVMMHLLLLEFYSALLVTAGDRAWGFLKTLGITERVLKLAQGEEEEGGGDLLERGLLQSKSSEVVAEVVTLFPREMEAERERLLGIVKQHLDDPFLGPHTPSLAILRSMPTEWVVGKGVVGLLPLSPPHHEFLAALAGLVKDERLFQEYMAANSELWERVVAYAGAPALGEVAVQALGIVDAVAAAGEWGVREILRAPGVLGLLAEVPDSFLGTRAGADTHGVGWRVLRRRWEVAGSVAARLQRGSRWRDVLEERVAMGIVGRRGEGFEIATMEM